MISYIPSHITNGRFRTMRRSRASSYILKGNLTGQLRIIAAWLLILESLRNKIVYDYFYAGDLHNVHKKYEGTISHINFHKDIIVIYKSLLVQ